MSDSEKTQNPGDMIAESMSSLFGIATIQMRATMKLSKALEKDESVSPETRAAATACLEEVDKMIDIMHETLSRFTDVDFRAGFKE